MRQLNGTKLVITDEFDIRTLNGSHSHLSVFDSQGNELSIFSNGDIRVHQVCLGAVKQDYSSDLHISTLDELLHLLAKFLGYSVAKL